MGGETAARVVRAGAPVRVDDGFVTAVATDVPRLRRLARLLVGEEADDLVAETLSRTLPKWRAGRVDDLGAYQRRVLVRLASRRWQRRALARGRDHAAATWVAEPHDAAEVIAERDRTPRAVRDLPPRRRAIVALRFDEDLSEARIAGVLGISVGTVESQLSTALAQLRRELEDG